MGSSATRGLVWAAALLEVLVSAALLEVLVSAAASQTRTASTRQLMITGRRVSIRAFVPVKQVN